ncbi:MAG: hypothetical protein HGA75_03915, partial [Thiobacillus sp.]|nr:hypothetical protein [Thiobacillus sp.]
MNFFPVWQRNYLVWKKLAIPAILGNLADPLLYMLGLGYGLGQFLGDIGGVPYLNFLAATARRTLDDEGRRAPATHP